jgi:hypothetical protein
MIPRLAWLLGLVGTLILTPGLSGDAAQGKGRPKAALRVNPALIFVPQRVVATAELTEGANDYQDYYCPKIEWIWGDETQSESGADCDPYEPGKSEIRRRYTADHTYKEPGNYDVIFRMKQGSKTVLSLRQQIRAQGQ